MYWYIAFFHTRAVPSRRNWSCHVKLKNFKLYFCFFFTFSFSSIHKEKVKPVINQPTKMTEWDQCRTLEYSEMKYMTTEKLSIIPFHEESSYTTDMSTETLSESEGKYNRQVQARNVFNKFLIAQVVEEALLLFPFFLCALWNCVRVRQNKIKVNSLATVLDQLFSILCSLMLFWWELRSITFEDPSRKALH